MGISASPARADRNNGCSTGGVAHSSWKSSPEYPLLLPQLRYPSKAGSRMWRSPQRLRALPSELATAMTLMNDNMNLGVRGRRAHGHAGPSDTPRGLTELKRAAQERWGRRASEVAKRTVQQTRRHKNTETRRPSDTQKHRTRSQPHTNHTRTRQHVDESSRTNA